MAGGWRPGCSRATRACSSGSRRRAGRRRDRLARALELPGGVTRDRLRLLTDAGLVAFATTDCELVHLTSSGAEYLEGHRDQALHPHPLGVGRATAGVLG